ncbi:MAG: hypothetical protein KC476_04655 [Cyanobacteria bacterium HKST-UBA06]|nr:hypothetical protein [Cyanobacteria bacterium HKST-UBA06]
MAGTNDRHCSPLVFSMHILSLTPFQRPRPLPVSGLVRTSAPAFGLGHRSSNGSGDRYNLATPDNHHGTWMGRNGSVFAIPRLLVSRFPHGTPILALGCSTGEATVLTTAMAIDKHPLLDARAHTYPITGIDIDPDIVGVANLKLLSRSDMTSIQNLFGQAYAKGVVAPVPPRLEAVPASLHRALRSVLLANYAELDKNDIVDVPLTASLEQAYDALAPVALSPRLAQRIHYEVGDVRQVTADATRMEQYGVVLADNLLYLLPRADQMTVARQLAVHMKPGAILVSSQFDLQRHAIDDLLVGMGFVRMDAKALADSTQTQVIYERPDVLQPDVDRLARFIAYMDTYQESRTPSVTP